LSSLIISHSCHCPHRHHYHNDPHHPHRHCRHCHCPVLRPHCHCPHRLIIILIVVITIIILTIIIIIDRIIESSHCHSLSWAWVMSHESEVINHPPSAESSSCRVDRVDRVNHVSSSSLSHQLVQKSIVYGRSSIGIG
jgi:hypothetical protein